MLTCDWCLSHTESVVFVGGSLGRIQVTNTNLEEDPDAVRSSFQSFLTQVISHVNDRRDQEELSIIE